MANVLEQLAAAIIPPAGTTTPASLYAEAVPRAERIMQQYDAAAPGIDFAIKYWWFVVAASFAAGVAASYVAQVLYTKKHRR